MGLLTELLGYLGFKEERRRSKSFVEESMKQFGGAWINLRQEDSWWEEEWVWVKAPKKPDPWYVNITFVNDCYHITVDKSQRDGVIDTVHSEDYQMACLFSECILSGYRCLGDVKLTLPHEKEDME